MILDAIAQFTRLLLPRNLQTVTIGVGITAKDEPLRAVFGQTQEITKHAIDFLRQQSWTLLDAPHGRTVPFHAERQLYNIGQQFIGLSHPDGMCPDCLSYFRNKSDATISTSVREASALKVSGSITWYTEPGAEEHEHNFLGDDPIFATNEVYLLLYGSSVELDENTAYRLKNRTPYTIYRFLKILRDLFNDNYDALKNSPKFQEQCRDDSTFRAKFAHGLGLLEQTRAFDAIMKLQGADQVAFLLDCLQRCSVDWQAACCRELGKFLDSRAVTKLCEISLQAEDPDLRYIAVQSLAINGNSSALVALTHVVQHDTGTDYEGRPISTVASQAIEMIQARRTN